MCSPDFVTSAAPDVHDLVAGEGAEHPRPIRSDGTACPVGGVAAGGREVLVLLRLGGAAPPGVGCRVVAGAGGLIELARAAAGVLAHDQVAGALDPDDYGASQALGRELRAAGGDGVVYPSVRRAGGWCIGIFWPNVIPIPVQGAHYCYHWNGERVDFVKRYEADGANAVFEVI